MAAVTLSAVVDLSKVKMKWQEQYVSEGLNHKVIPASPKGVYRGLHLVQNISAARLVDVQAGTDGRHEAVHQSVDGFSMTYFDAVGTTTTLDLSSASLDSQETVIVLQIIYEIGIATTANWIAYPIADWNALSTAAQDEFVVLGTINVPAPATNITTTMILPKRRTYAWMNQAPGAVAWSPLLRNSGFEVADLSASYAHSASFWEFNSSTNAIWTVQQTSPRTGNNALALNYTATGSQSADFSQYIGVGVTPGQVLRYQLFIQNLKVPSVGTFIQLIFRFSNLTGTGENDRTVNIPMTAIDASYREVSETFAVPNNAGNLVSIIVSSGLGEGTTGIAYRIDDFQIWIDSSATQLGGLDANRRGVSTSALVVEDNNDPFDLVYGRAALITQLIDELRLERRDQNITTQNPIEFALKTARITKLGSDLLNTNARAALARITAPASTVSASTLTLLWESARAGETTGTYTQGVVRMYVSSQGQLMFTVNAFFNASTLLWNKDVNGVGATKLQLQADQFDMYAQDPAVNTPWADAGGWTFQPVLFYGPTETPALFGHMQFIGDTLIQGSNVAPDAVTQTLKSPSSHTNLLLDVQSYDGRGTVAIDNAGRLYRRGAYFFEDFDGLVLDTNRWTLSNIGTGTTGTSNPGTHTYQMTPGTGSGNFYQIAGQMFFVRKNFPRMRARIFTGALNPANILGNAGRVFVGWTSLYLDYNQATHGNPTHWYLFQDGTFFDTGINAIIDGGAGISAGQIISLAQVGTNQVLVTIHTQNDTFASATQVVITTGALSTSGRALVAGIVNTTGHSPAPTLAVDFMESAECSRLD